jgi:diguanylate cyclase (GGDEF)-like protein
LSALAEQENNEWVAREAGLEPSVAGRHVTSDSDLAREEATIGKIAWFGGVAVALVTVACLTLLIMTAEGYWWEYVLYGVVAGVPFAYALFCNLIMRRMDLAVFSRYRARLMHQLTDLQELVNRDELTGLYNRRHFYEVMRMEVDKARVSKQPLAVFLLDLDGLKVINDEHGHGVGDVILANLGRSIATHTRGGDLPARLGGDEFGIVMPGTDKRGAFALARRLWADLEATPMFQDHSKTLMVTVSIGLAGYPWGGESVEEMIQWADADMYANKVSRKLARDSEVAAGIAVGDMDAVEDDVFGSI